MTPTRRAIVWFGHQHVTTYERSDGRIGAKLLGKPMTILWTTGRRSGELRSTALLCLPRGEDVIVVGSFYGSDKHPAWYLNLLADPHCTVRLGRRKYAAIARTAEGDEREQLWAELVAGWKSYEGYQAATERELPVVVLSPAPSA